MIERPHFESFLVWTCDVNNHVTGPTGSDPVFLKAFDRDKSLINDISEYRVGKLITREIEEKITQYVWDVFQFTWDCSWRQSMTSDDTENLNRNLELLQTPLSQDLSISPSIFDVWGSYRTLCLPTGHRGRNAHISKPYCALWGRF